MDSRAGQQSQKLLNKTAKWSESFYDKGPEYVEEMLSAQGEGCNGIVYIEYHYNQIGKTEEWLQRISQKIGNPLTVRREILLQRLHGSSLSPYAQEDIEYIVSTEHTPIDEMWLMNFYKFDVYEPLDKNIPYIAGIDCATGTLGDNNAITLINPYTCRPAAEFECSFIGETKYELLIKELVKELPRVVLCIERNSIGDGIIDHLLYSEVNHRLYFDRSLNLLQDKMDKTSTIESMLKKEAKKKTYYGVYTSGQSREDMFSILNVRVSEHKDDFIAHNIIRDISGLVKLSSGKIAAGPTSHDDSIMSYLIAMYVYTHGNNLEVFGVHKGQDPDRLPNQGMKRPEDIDPNLVDPSLIRGAMEARAKEARMNEFEQLMKNAIRQSQQDSYKLSKAGLVDNIYNESEEAIVYDDGSYDDEELSFFDELNGLGQYNKMIGSSFDIPTRLF